MNDEDWKEIKNFSKKDNWGDPQKINKKLVQALDRLADKTGEKIFISQGTQGRHVANSQHYLGRAADCLFPNLSDLRDLYTVFLVATQIDEFKGFGIYPHWHYKSRIIGGIHLDIRETANSAFWMGVLDTNGKTQYLGINDENLQKYGFL